MHNKDHSYIFYDLVFMHASVYFNDCLKSIKNKHWAPKFIPRSSLKLLEDSETLRMLVAAPDALEYSPNSKQDWREKS